MGSTMMKQLQGKVAFITGAGRGIGAGIASVLASRGASVAVCDVDGSAAKETADQINGAGGRVIAGAGDGTDPDSLQQFTSLAIVELGSIDICVPNAGVIGGKGFSARKDFTKQDWDMTFAVNVHGVANTVDSVKQHMMDRQQGKIVIIASHGGRKPRGVADRARGTAQQPMRCQKLLLFNTHISLRWNWGHTTSTSTQCARADFGLLCGRRLQLTIKNWILHLLT